MQVDLPVPRRGRGEVILQVGRRGAAGGAAGGGGAGAVRGVRVTLLGVSVRRAAARPPPRTHARAPPARLTPPPWRPTRRT